MNVCYPYSAICTPLVLGLPSHWTQGVEITAQGPNLRPPTLRVYEQTRRPESIVDLPVSNCLSERCPDYLSEASSSSGGRGANPSQTCATEAPTCPIRSAASAGSPEKGGAGLAMPALLSHYCHVPIFTITNVLSVVRNDSDDSSKLDSFVDLIRRERMRNMCAALKK